MAKQSLGRAQRRGGYLWPENGGTGQPAPLLRVLPGGPTSAQIGVSGLSGTHGEMVTCTRGSSKFCLKAGGSSLAVLGNNVAAVEPNGLLVEPAATNLILQSQTMATAPWTLSHAGTGVNPVLTNNAAVAPDGTTTATEIDLSSVPDNTAASNIFQGFTATAAVYTLSVWLRAVSGTATVYLFIGNTVYAVAACSLTTTWQKFTLTTPTLSAATYFFCLGVDATRSGQATQPAQSIYAWGAQAELGPVATSYATTVGSTVTRPADLISLGQYTPGTVFGMTADINLRSLSATNQLSVLRLYNTANDQWLLVVGTDGTVTGNYFNGSQHITQTVGTVTTNAVQRLGLTYDGANIQVWLNGTRTAGAFVFAPSSTFTSLYLGTNPDQALDTFNGWISNIRLFPAAYPIF